MIVDVLSGIGGIVLERIISAAVLWHLTKWRNS